MSFLRIPTARVRPGIAWALAEGTEDTDSVRRDLGAFRESSAVPVGGTDV